jgi:Na+/pantothenate symporter
VVAFKVLTGVFAVFAVLCVYWYRRDRDRETLTMVVVAAVMEGTYMAVALDANLMAPLLPVLIVATLCGGWLTYRVVNK